MTKRRATAPSIGKFKFLFYRAFRPDGRQYEGGWLQGKQHGTAKYTNATGKVRIGIWDRGKRLKWLEETTPEEGFGEGVER